MFEHTTHINGTTRYLRLFLVLLVGALVAGALTVTPSPASSTGYHWPVKPFTSEHPVRGNFGDPRTVFHVPPTTEGALYGGGSFQFHFGVDIAAPDGTQVYPVASGKVSTRTTDWVGISCSDGRSFQYWHISPAVRVGDHVTAFKTVLGRILPGAMHVHFTEIQGGRPVNPLQPGHLTPYTDREAPRIQSISVAKVSRDGRACELPPRLRRLRGRGPRHAEPPRCRHLARLPVAPARIGWRIENMNGKVVVRNRVAVDFRSTSSP